MRVGNDFWSCICSDAEAFLAAQPDDSIDMLFGSPPYELARTYGIGERMLGGQAWVDWMVRIVKAAAPKVRGLIAINCEGQTRKYKYSGAPFLLFADLHRAGFNMRKPPIFKRVGIPGSGGPDWLRNDYEPIICITRPGRLLWSDNTACGHPPKWAPPGGEMSSRLSDGTRVNQSANGNKEKPRIGKARPSHQVLTKRLTGTATSGIRNGDAQTVPGGYYPPVLANPGNVIACNVGGGQMGHKLAHENEAPFPLAIAEFFVKSFAPPGGLVCDPWSGSGTTCEAAVTHGRRFIGCDIRESQVRLCERRMRTVTPSLLTA